MKNEKNNKSILEESLIDFKNIQQMISKNSENQIKDILSEKIKEGLKNIITEADDFEEDEFDSEKETKDGMDDMTPESGESLEGENEPEDIDVDVNVDSEEGDGTEPEDVDIDIDTDGEEEDEEDFDFDQFKTGEDEYDLTNNSIEDVVKVFKKIDDNDSIIVKKLENGKIELVDNEADTEYLIDMGDDGEEFEVELDDEDEDAMSDEDEFGEENESVDLTEDTGDTEVELDGAEDQVDEKNMTQSIGTNRRAGRMTQTRKANAPGANNRDGAKLIANESKEIAKAYSRKVKQIEAAYAKKFETLTEEVSQYKQALIMFRDKLKENAVLNNNLAKYVKLVTENATTKDEKLQILERFTKEANTIEAGNQLFEAINSELNKKGTPEIGINIEKQFSVSAPQKINEQVIYQSKDLQETISLINRMNGLNKK
jgi:hypothetical protein